MRIVSISFLVILILLSVFFYQAQDTEIVVAQSGTEFTAGIGTPTLDGIESEGEWMSESVTTSRGVTIKAMIDENNLYVLTTWADGTNSVSKDQWTFDGTGWAASGDEDRIGIVWDMKDENGNSLNGTDGPSCTTMCHLPIMRTQIGRVDVWHWKAHRFNPMGFSDDKYWDTCEDCEDGGRHGDEGSGSGGRNRNDDRTGPEFMADSDPNANVDFLADDQATLDAFDPYGVLPGSVGLRVDLDPNATFDVGAVVPGRRLTIPSGNRASVRSAGRWENGVWTVEFSRSLEGEVDSEGQPEDFAVELGGSVQFTTDIFDDLADHSQHAFVNGGADLGVYTLHFPNPTELSFAQFADGDGLFSQITLFGLAAPDGALPAGVELPPGRALNQVDANVTISLKTSSGDPMSVDINGELVNGVLETVVPASGIRTFKTDGIGDVTVGSVRVESDQGIAGVILFGGTVGLAGVQNSEVLENGFTGPMETNSMDVVNTGIAVMNLEDSDVTLTAQLCDSEGGVLATAVVTIPAMGQIARFVTEFDWDTPLDVDLFADFVGLLKVSTSGKVAATVIQTRPGQFATMPVVAN